MKGRIDAFDEDDDDGNLYHIKIWQEYVDASSLNGENWIPGMKYAETSDGHKCNYIDEETFEVVSLSRRIRRV